MRSNIYYNLKEYKENYIEEFSMYQSKFNEANEKDFINEQIKFYQICMNNTCIVKRPDGSTYSVLSVYKDTEQVKSILDEFMDSGGTRFDRDKCTSLFFGFKRIKEFLERNTTSIKIPKKLLLKDLFISESKFKEIINLLKENNYVSKTELGLVFIGYKEEVGLTAKRHLSSLGFTLNKKNYLKPGTQDLDITTALTNTFNITISKAVYSASIKEFKGNSPKGQDYISSLHFIPKYKIIV